MVYIYLTNDNLNSYNIYNSNVNELDKIANLTNLPITNNRFISFRKEELSKYNKILNRNGYICKINNNLSKL